MSRNLIINWYKAQTHQRQLEIEYCLWKNLNSGLFDKFFFWCRAPLPSWVRITKHMTIEYSQKYPTFTDLIVNGFRSSHTNIVCNTDIYFDQTLELVPKLANQVVCLSRWERSKKRWSLYKNHKCSQDTWIFQGRVQHELAYRLNFRMGMLGCDNSIVHHVLQAGYKAINPALAVRSYHVHFSQQRYMQRVNPEDVVPPPYVLLPASGLF